MLFRSNFMNNVNLLLNGNGVFIFEAPYFVNLLQANEYDTIYHEHLSYLSVKPLIPFFSKFDLEVFDIEQVDIHGGSFRVFVGKRGARPVSGEITRLLEQEKRSGIYTHGRLDRFAEQVENNKRDLIWLLQNLKHEGKRIVGVSAPAKGMTLLNYSKLKLNYIVDDNPLKHGLYTPGMHVPIKHPDVLKQEKEKILVVPLAWNFFDEIKQKTLERNKNVKFIRYFPELSFE